MLLFGTMVDTAAIVRDRYGCTVRGDSGIYLLFSADSMFEGGTQVLDALDRAGIKGNFFFTGNFLRDSVNASVIRRVVAEGHYVGPHSDGHILLAAWDRNRTSLVTPDSLLADLRRNYSELSRFGVDSCRARVVLPPYEWCAAEHVRAYRSAGYEPINPTPGIETYRDYTVPGTPEYRTAQFLVEQLYDYEARRGLQGAFIIIHAGTEDARPDKLYSHLSAILERLAQKYEFRTFSGD